MEHPVTPPSSEPSLAPPEDDVKARTRAWEFTLNNYTEDEVERITALSHLPTVERMVVGKEIGKERGTPHLQGYIRFTQPVRFAWWKNQFPRASVRKRAGTETVAATYCKKEGNVIIDKGVNCDEDLSVTRGKRSREDELDEVITEIKSGAKYGQVRARHERFFFWNRRRILEYWHDHKRIKHDPDFHPNHDGL